MEETLKYLKHKRDDDVGMGGSKEMACYKAFIYLHDFHKELKQASCLKLIKSLGFDREEVKSAEATFKEEIERRLKRLKKLII